MVSENCSIHPCPSSSSQAAEETKHNGYLLQRRHQIDLNSAVKSARNSKDDEGVENSYCLCVQDTKIVGKTELAVYNTTIRGP
ncbi:hypothetical protein EJB05_23276 [Eragrostis curvula]|uniref:Uncharacterized protein n=1 Tax=Eragrostis curvula TaxID=38414 RepID=A0A5J9V6N8_9POAL|nr:hypothetical protein EJB05_23276 [Eragrostis curvula]